MSTSTHAVAACAGVITRVAIKCVPASAAVSTLLMSLSSFQDVQRVFGLAHKHLAEILSAFEFFDRQSMALALQHVQGAVAPFADLSNMYVLVETSGVVSFLVPFCFSSICSIFGCVLGRNAFAP
jgi:FAD/FMN-containing dehydrogenase